MNLTKRLMAALGMIVLGAAFFSCRKSPAYTKIEGEAFHTYYHIKYKGETDYTSVVDSVLKRFSHSLNPFDSTSVIAAINRNVSTDTDSLFRRVFRRAQAIAEVSGGSYDITCAPLINAWGFGFEHEKTITPELIDSLRAFVGYRKVRLDGNAVVKDDPRLMLNTSSIAKGYASDLVAEALASRAITDYMVEIGGEVAYSGLNPQGKLWRIGVNKPVDDSTGIVQELELIVELEGKGGLATSGNYRNYYLRDGKKYAHTIDPLSGYPVQTDVLSATVIASDCMTADALATTFMVVGSERVAAIAEKLSVDYLLILSDGEGSSYRVVMSDGFRRRVVN